MGRVVDDLVARVVSGGAVALDDLFNSSDALQDGDEAPSTRYRDLPRLQVLPDGWGDSLPWNSASIMGDAGHNI